MQSSPPVPPFACSMGLEPMVAILFLQFFFRLFEDSCRRARSNGRVQLTRVFLGPTTWDGNDGEDAWHVHPWMNRHVQERCLACCARVARPRATSSSIPLRTVVQARTRAFLLSSEKKLPCLHDPSIRFQAIGCHRYVVERMSMRSSSSIDIMGGEISIPGGTTSDRPWFVKDRSTCKHDEQTWSNT